MTKNFVPGQRIWTIERREDPGIEDVAGTISECLSFMNQRAVKTP